MKIEIDLLVLVGSWVVCIIWGWGAGVYMSTFLVTTKRFLTLAKRVDALEEKSKQ